MRYKLYRSFPLFWSLGPQPRLCQTDNLREEAVEHVRDAQPGVGGGLAVHEPVQLSPQPRLDLVNLPGSLVTLVGRQEADCTVQPSTFPYQLEQMKKD